MPPPKLQTPPAMGFDEHVESCVQRLRGALTELMSSMDADPGAPQVVSRRFGLNKNLAWKLSKIVHAAHAADAVPHLPGPGGLEIALRAFERGGAPAQFIERVREELAGFDVMVELHAGDRATLELMLGSQSASHSSDPRMVASRKQAFQANGSIFGVQARVRFGAQFVAPSDDPALLDTASMGGLLDFRRLRASARWPLMFNLAYNDDGTPREQMPEPIDRDGVHAGGAPLMREFCSDPHPELQSESVPTGTLYELAEGPVGNTGAFSSVLGWCARGFATRYKDELNDHAEHYLPLNVPCELALFDLYVHRELEFEMPPELRVLSHMELGMHLPASAGQRYRLPIDEKPQDLGSGPPIVATPHVANYGRMVQRVNERMGWDARDFRGYRFTWKYPPIPTVPMFCYPLLER